MPTWVTPPDYTDGQFLEPSHMDDISTDLTYLYNIGHEVFGGRVPSVLWTTTSTTFTDWNGGTPLDVSFTKRGGTETTLKIELHTSAFVTGGATVNAQYAFRIGSTDYTNSYPRHFNVVSQHEHHTQTVFIPGLIAATYSARLRVLISAQTFSVDGNDFAEFTISEIVNG